MHLGKRESREVHLTKRSRSEPMGWEWKMGDGGWMTTFPYPTTYTLVHGCVEGDWPKSGGPWHPEFMLCAFVCEHVCVWLCTYASVWMSVHVWVNTLHTCTSMCLCVCTCVYIWVHHINTPILSVKHHVSQGAIVELGLYW